MERNDITDDAVKTAFQESNMVYFMARPFNSIEYRGIIFEGYDFSLPLIKVFSVIGVTPQMLRPVFSPQEKLVKRTFPFNLSWFGLNKECRKVVNVELPSRIDTYEQLGSFPLNKERFVKLAMVLNKKIKVIREEGTGESYPLFVVHPSGEIETIDS